MLAALEPTAHSGESTREPAPSLEAFAALFPQLELLELIGQGGMGCVFKARQPKLNRLVALKLLPSSLAEGDGAFAQRFEREGQLLARLHHPNIVAVHDSGTAGEFFYLIMEYVDGVNLRQAMRARRFTPAQALAIVPHICDALQYAHDEGVLHRDIKPENILLGAKGRVKLADFGIAKLLADFDLAGAAAPSDAGLTQSGAMLGTPSYMAPEQRDTPNDIDHRADIYSLGVVFYELLTGELPRERFTPPSAQSDADPCVDAIVQQALEKERARRQHSAREVKTQVERVTSLESAGAPGRLRRSWWRRQLVKGAVALVCLLVIRTWFVQAFVTPSDAAAPEIPEGSRFLVWKLAHRFAPGDLVAYRNDGNAYVGRVTRVDPGQFRVSRNDSPDVTVAAEAIIGRVFSVYWRGMATGGVSPPAPAAAESWHYTPRYLTGARFSNWQKSVKGERPELSQGTTFKMESGVISLTGPRERVRLLATMLRVVDQPEAKNPIDLPILNMPPDFFLRIALPALILGESFVGAPAGDALIDLLKSEGVTAPQLGRALAAHVLELEKATFVNTGPPFESIVHSPGASTFYDVAIPCTDQPDKPLTLRIERTTQQMGTLSKFSAFAPWLVEEAKKQSKEPFHTTGKGETPFPKKESTAVPAEPTPGK